MAAKKSAVSCTVDEALARLRKRAKKSVRDGMVRFGIPNDRAIGVAVGDIRDIGKAIGRDHALALSLFEEDCYEARMLACFLGEPSALAVRQMDAWRRTFDNWAICDTACFHLFDKSPLAWGRIAAWSKRKDEFGKRAAFALLASLALHGKKADAKLFVAELPRIRDAACDDRNFVKKAVSWALRGIGKRGGECLKQARALANELAKSDDAAERWVGKDALRDFAKR
jgi:3-methyladenine DNA glycosylase AlkD